MSIYKGTRAERYRSRMRSIGKQSAIEAGRRACELLDRYILARKGEFSVQPVILWGRIALVTVGIIIAFVLILRLLV